MNNQKRKSVAALHFHFGICFASHMLKNENMCGIAGNSKYLVQNPEFADDIYSDMYLFLSFVDRKRGIHARCIKNLIKLFYLTQK